ncbi:MAG: hypothetical protein P9L92_18345 [Candidatus Electryonea clarkiae]|nr:hypothetical protein [Candidatus Electryonea clarkiae]MDP8288492.1 hypothetical protein [Candidatus Electryonea clarkiae]
MSTAIHRTHPASPTDEGEDDTWTSGGFYPSQGVGARCTSSIDMSTCIGDWNDLLGRIRLFTGSVLHEERHLFRPPNEEVSHDFMGDEAWGDIDWYSGNNITVIFESANNGVNGDEAEFDFNTI